MMGGQHTGGRTDDIGIKITHKGDPASKGGLRDVGDVSCAVTSLRY